MNRNKDHRQAAQNQHYVPKFILRNFLSDPQREQVSVFRKSDGKGFVTSIRNIMAERRFHEFSIGEHFIASFEDGIGKIEEMILPTYRNVVEQKRLTKSPEERAGLAILIAFQFLRTRQQRERFLDFKKQLAAHLEKTGEYIEDIEGYEPFTEDSLTRQHVEFIKHGIGEFAHIVAEKDFLLLHAPDNRSFYLGDNPVCLNNIEPAGPFYGNIGFGVRGIEIYLPLTAKLMLAAWCPSLIQRMRNERMEVSKKFKGYLLQLALEGKISNTDMKNQIENQCKMFEPADKLISCFVRGEPIEMSDENMDYNNSLQMSHAREFVICKDADFLLAKRFINDFPNNKGRFATLR